MVQEDSSPRLLPKVATPLSLRAAILFSGEYPNRFNCQTKTPRFRGKLFHDRQSRFPKSPIELLKPARRQSKPAQQRFRRPVMPAENFSCSLPLDGLRSIRPRIRHKKTPKKPVKTRFQNGVWNYLKESCIWHLAKSNGYTILCLFEANWLWIVSFLLANFWPFNGQKIVGKKLGFLLDHRWHLPMNA